MGGRCTKVDYDSCSRYNLKVMGVCKVMAGEKVARQHRMATLETRKRKRKKPGPKIKW